jgi:hypothetical protein
MDIKNIKTKVRDFWVKYEYRVILVFGFILVSAISFEAGFLRGQKIEPNSIIIEKTVETRVAGDATEDNALPADETGKEEKNTDEKKDCMYVGSKNSDKYHLPTCSYAKRIKPENVTCFSSVDEAKSKGYQPDKSCIK